ncbi:FAD-dependent oxidoreductase [Saccharicrinis fermentans]|uniref:Tricarballylate dehydrogenase n=1 Tax=Saccharicrinis fermentans DSM 9555 = JCM 21142 TaxID=869213 RepID=W7YCH7_9BACT|nr:FAD-dependent oxidoreductase [Saccharicrinis fermentans]GAF02156.1 tricarballylate dehydrogenase [Saccharicrinis fermentans DSM 9555 = JCM 21142]
MKRRDFFRKSAASALGASLVPSVVNAAGLGPIKPDRTIDNWLSMGTGEMREPTRKKEVTYGVAVLGGGLAGMCAAVAAARNGAKVVLVQDRPVLGGNASSEMRVHVNGVTHLKPDNFPERETGIIEEILLHNRFFNPQESFAVWDHVLYDFIYQEDNIDLMLNTQATRAIMSGDKIASAHCWQITTETEYIIHAKQFIDCSGDGLLAASAGALYRTGREASSEFGEKYAPKVADGWQMGATLLMLSKDMGKPVFFDPPSYTIKYDAEKSHPKRNFKAYQDGIWWVEVGSDDDIIGEREIIRHKLMGYMYGVWDYIKNSGKFPEAENLALDWVGSIPGMRESRRFIGDYILSEKDLLGHTHFSDAVAYGGWSLDEHNPGGIENLKEPPSYFHERFSEVYEIPYRSLYSKNISNLFFAGRNISQTHIALSSTRVMATCALMGHAVGIAAAMCVQKNIFPRDITHQYMNELQEKLLREDAFIPNRPARDINDLAKKSALVFASSTSSGDVSLLLDGISRDFNNEVHHWQSDGLPAEVQLEWKNPVTISTVEIKCDTNLRRNIMMRKDSKVSDSFWNDIPKELIKSLELVVRVSGEWIRVGSLNKNMKRLIKFNFDTVKVTAVRIILNDTYGVRNAKLFEIRCYR